jgi:hypothetical protein
MSRRVGLNRKHIELMGTICGSLLLGVPAALQPAIAQTQPINELGNPCPQIYYEEPFNTNNLVPPGCSPNAISEQLGVDQESAPAGTILGRPEGNTTTIDTYNLPDTNSPNVTAPNSGASSIPAQPPLPEELGTAIATVMPMNGSISIQLVNNTNAAVTYEVIGDTEPRMLMARQSVTLSGLSVPTTVTTVRQDDGFLNLNAVSTAPGRLEVSLEEEPNLDETQGVLRIQNDGQVYVN